MFDEADASGEEFSEQLDRGHKATCPWKGNSCPESLVQFPPTSPSALIGGFKDRCDGLLQFYSLPIVSSSAVEQMRVTHSPQIDCLLTQLQIQTAGELGCRSENACGMGLTGEQAPHPYSHVRFFLDTLFYLNYLSHASVFLPIWPFGFIISILTLIFHFNRLKSS